MIRSPDLRKLMICILALMMQLECNGVNCNAKKYDLAVCTIFRDDAPYLKEWIEFHLLIGVKHFYLYNHLSADDFEEVIKPYTDCGLLDLIYWPFSFSDTNHEAWIAVQTNAYNHALKNYGENCCWMAFIDSDEFLFPVVEDNLPSVLKNYEDFGGICVNWIEFGTSHIEQIPIGDLMIEHLVMSAPALNRPFHKSIVQPQFVESFRNVHSPIFLSPHFAINTQYQMIPSEQMLSEPILDTIQINHYWTRDENYFYNYKLRCRHRRGWSYLGDLARAEKSNQQFNYSIARFISRLKAALEKVDNEAK